MINQEEFMKALAEEKNLVDILTQNGRYYEGMDLWKFLSSLLLHQYFYQGMDMDQWKYSLVRFHTRS